MRSLAPVSDLYFPHAVISSIDPLASSAGLAKLRAGGSCVDAAIAANAVLAVTAPDQCGLGGDLLALVFEPQSGRGSSRVHACQSIGRAGSGVSASQMRENGLTSIPRDHPAAVTVPGCVDGWLTLHERFGRLPIESLFGDAIELARNGFPVRERLFGHREVLRALASFSYFESLTGPKDTLTLPGIARTLESIGDLGRDGFYGGEFGVDLLKFGQGIFAPQDLGTPLAQWEEPVSVRAFGADIFASPRPSAGYLTLALCGALSARDPLPPFGSTGWYLTMADVLSESRAHHREHHDGGPLSVGGLFGHDTDTTAITCVDEHGYACVLVQSNAQGFGSLLATETNGVFLHDRGATGFNLEPGDPNEIAPRKRPRHTLSPVIACTQDNKLALVTGTMGGDRQPSILAQLIAAVLASQVGPAEALAAPRIAMENAIDSALSGFDAWFPGARQVIAAEGHIERETALALQSLRSSPSYSSEMGVAHLIDARGASLVAATDPRALAGSPFGY